ncbi:SDR family NAD(P)-dependent oxidoreductase [Paraburkholderia sp. IW21]|jgi:3-oxoacyl-[acyl-carrier protein] reductase|uniref:SDR family NAD(P)-dependent oxidoreductase n=1 Tax=Paraburkholderia sp. IW21 TaxID=3242488 RepID=UPI003520B753
MTTRIDEPFFPEGAAIVVGGSGGIGREICRCLADLGADVALTYRNNADAAAQVQNMIEQSGRKAYTGALNVADGEATKAFIDAVAEQFSRVHTVVFASGANFRLAYLADIDPDEWARTITGDLTGFFNVTKAAIPHLRKGGGGSFVALTSAALVRHSPKDILSTAPKAGIEALIRAIAREEGRFNIRANAVAVGAIDGGLMDRVWEQVSPEFGQAMRSNTSLKRLGTPREVADATVYLASSRASFITGQSLTLDGGYSV